MIVASSTGAPEVDLCLRVHGLRDFFVDIVSAEDLGLSTCWVCHFDPRVAIDELGLPSDLYPVHMLTVGYAADRIADPEAREARTIPMSEFRLTV